MLFAKSTLLVALFALSEIVAATGTPACLLSAIGDEGPGNLKAICNTNSDDIQSKINDLCGDGAQDALKYYTTTCKEGGYTVEIQSTSTSSSSSTSTSVSSSRTSTGFTTTTPTSGSSTSESKSESASTTDSGASPTESSSASTDKQVSAAAFAAVVFLGFAATL